MKTVKERNKELEERLMCFAKRILDLASELPIASDLRHQLARAGTSPDANYIEACEAVSSSDFTYRIAIVLKEIRETVYWLKLTSYAHSNLRKECVEITAEAEELVRIFATILKKFKK